MSEFLPFPQKKYNIIYADPPWRYSDRGCNGNAEDHYETMTFKDLCRLPVSGNGGGSPGIAAEDCVLLMWATYPMMREALFLIDAWGFTYKSIAFQWVKQNRSGNGYFFWAGTLDAGQHGAVPVGSQGQAQTCVKRRQPAHYVTDPRTQPQAGRSTRPHCGAAGGLAAHRAVCPRGGTRLGLLGQRGSNKWGVPL